jgi:hypothetical protein
MAAPPLDIPCEPFTTDAEVRECCVGLDIAFDLTDIIAFSSAVLYRLSGRQFPGECERTVWPCKGSGCGCCAGIDTGDWWWSYHNYPSWPVPNGLGTGFVNVGHCDRTCRLDRVKLPATVNSIVDITIDGVTLAPTDYKIEAYRWVVRVDGGSWPCVNDLTGEPGDPGVWTITYNYGKPVPNDGRYAARIFACELAKARCGADNCLPARLKEISRQGVDMSFADPLEFLEKGEVGIYEVDLWLNSVNPSKLKRRSRIHRPDRPHTNTTFT